MKRLVFSAGMSAALLLASKGFAYRTGADLAELAGSERVRWQPARIEYQLHEQGAPGLAFHLVVHAAGAASETWRTPSCASVMISTPGPTSLPATPDDGKNTIQWLTSGWLEHGFGTETAGVTDTLYERGADNQWRIIEADIYLDAEHLTWSVSPGQGDARDVRTVLTHELGHVLGLLHPCEPDGADGAPACSADGTFAQATMYPFYGAGQSSLGEDDTAGVCFLYPVVLCEKLGCAEGQVCASEGCVERCGDTACALGEVCGANGCERPSSVTPVCTSDEDCRLGLGCTDGTCSPGPGALGDPCTRDSQCQTRACDSSGFCANRCDSDAACGEGVCSAAAETGTRACESELHGLGESCNVPADCLGGECLQVGSSAPICTRSCRSGSAVCPQEWQCTRVGEERVCAPLFAAGNADDGCTVGAAHGLRSGSEAGDRFHASHGAYLMCLLACAAALRRARQRLSKRRTITTSAETHGGSSPSSVRELPERGHQ